MPADPHSGSKVWKAPDREIGKPGENRGKVFAHRNLQPSAAFRDRENRRNFRPGQWTADVQPVLSTRATGRREFSARLLLSSNPESGKTRSDACRCSQTSQPIAGRPLVSLAWVLTTYFLQSFSLNTDRSSRTGVLVGVGRCWSDAHFIPALLGTSRQLSASCRRDVKVV